MQDYLGIMYIFVIFWPFSLELWTSWWHFNLEFHLVNDLAIGFCMVWIFIDVRAYENAHLPCISGKFDLILKNLLFFSCTQGISYSKNLLAEADANLTPISSPLTPSLGPGPSSGKTDNTLVSKPSKVQAVKKGIRQVCLVYISFLGFIFMPLFRYWFIFCLMWSLICNLQLFKLAFWELWIYEVLCFCLSLERKHKEVVFCEGKLKRSLTVEAEV